MTKAPAKGITLHVLTSLDFGGVESQMRLIDDNADLSGWDHAFCALGGGGATLDHLLTSGTRAEVFQRRVRIPSLSAIFALWRHLRRLRPDVLHLHGAEANFHGAIAGRLAGVPVILAEEIGIPNHSAKARRVFAWVYRRCDRIIAISQAVKDNIVALDEATPEMIEVVYNPFEPQEVRNFPQPAGQIRLGFVGRLEMVKNAAAAVGAVEILRNRGHDASLRIIGEGSQRADLERRITASGLGAHVELSGFQSAPFDLLQDCQFYLQPSLSEGFGLAICEAMSAGLPVIASAVGGTPEIITHGETGWLLPTPDAENLADMIEEAAALDADTMRQVAERARASVIERFGVATYLQRLDHLYGTLTGREGRR